MRPVQQATRAPANKILNRYTEFNLGKAVQTSLKTSVYYVQQTLQVSMPTDHDKTCH